MNHEKLLEKLNKYHAAEPSCNSVFCSTCGGIAYSVRNDMNASLKEEIKLVLAEISISEFKSLREWGEFMYSVDPNGVYSVFEREAKSIRSSDIQKLDGYLICARHYVKNSLTYRKLLDLGIKLAVQTANDSLIETVAIILGDEILKNDKLFKLALQKSKSNSKIHLVLYNFVREQVPEVRRYEPLGSGLEKPSSSAARATE